MCADLTRVPGPGASEKHDVRIFALTLVGATLYASHVSAQSTDAVESYAARPGTAVISGHVTTVDGSPAAGAEVLLSTLDVKRRILADDQGWFEFVELPPAEYQVSA